MLTEDLRAQLEGQRWFGGGAAELATATIEAERTLPTDPVVVQVLVRVGDERYQLLLDGEGYDATSDSKAVLGLLEMVMPGQETASVRPLGAEQSNTSLVCDERLLLKVFRRVTDAPNRDAELPAGLSAVGFDHVPAVLARWQEDGRDYAIVQPFLAGATDGWSLALVSLRQLFDEGTEPEHAGGDFGPEAHRLGEVTGQLHAALADAFGTAPAEPRPWATRLADGLRAPLLERMSDGGRIMAVHGDYHLAQVLRTDTAWFVVDFEGEPARREDERHEWSSPLKDVAGMLRSFDYAAAVAARESSRDREVEGVARHWERRNRQAFLDGYWPTVAGTGLVPGDPATRDALLETFELDKALYEVRYEEAHRPGWADIPKAAVARLVT